MIGVWIGATSILFSPYFFSPTRDKLTSLTGRFELLPSTRKVQGKPQLCQLFRIENRPIEGAFMNWFPHYGQLSQLLNADQPVTVLVDTRRTNWVWEVRQANQVTVSYEEIYKSQWAFQREDRLIGGFLTYGLAVLFTLFYWWYYIRPQPDNIQVAKRV